MNGPIAPVLHPAIQSKAARSFSCPAAEPDPLDPPLDEDLDVFIRCFADDTLLSFVDIAIRT